MTDLAVRRSGQPAASSVAAQPAASGTAAQPAPATADTHRSASPARPAAGALHNRIKPAHTLDLRKPTADTHAAASPSPEAKPSVSPHAHDLLAAQPKTAAHERHLAHFADRLNQAKQYDRSPHVSRFGDRPAPTAGDHAAGAAARSAIRSTEHQYRHAAQHTSNTSSIPQYDPQTHHAPTSGLNLPHHTATQHQAMSRLVQPQDQPTAHNVEPGTPKLKTAGRPWRPHLKLSPHTSRVMAVTAAVGIMAGYVWLQNYPKLALQSASARAGLSASLPSYIPSSYNLTHTDTAPGLVTLRFTSPGAAETLTIAQARTTWDSSSLLDNFIAKTADDYTTVQGQGLTIYLFNNNQATWVNHGIRYSIEGAARLSREQILKIAYSL